MEYLTDGESVRAIIVDVSHNFERFGVLIDALNARLIGSIDLVDDKFGSVSLKLADKNYFIPKTNELFISPEIIAALKSMILDVAIGNAFRGYHLDAEINDNVDLSIIIS